MIYKKLTAVLLAGVLLVGCGGQAVPVPPDNEPPFHPLFSAVFLNPLEPPEGSELIHDIPNLVYKVAAAYSLNGDTAGWLQAPSTTIDDVVVYYDDANLPQPNSFYLRRNFEKRYSFDGIYFADYRCTFDGTADGLQRSTVIYGHSMDDNYDGRLMSQLKKYDLDLNPNGEQFAREHPYLFFSLANQNLAWEIFAVFDTTTRLPYNVPTLNDQDFEYVMQEARARSFYSYDAEVTKDDKILILSTCTYKYDKNYPNDYRYVIMAKLVENTEPLRQFASFEVNNSRKAP